VNTPVSFRVAPDRRANRVTIPDCRKCGDPGVDVIARTDAVVYVRCAPCGHFWSLPKPGIALPASRRSAQRQPPSEARSA